MKNILVISCAQRREKELPNILRRTLLETLVNKNKRFVRQMSFLTAICQDNPMARVCMKKSETAEFPNGLAWLAIKNLEKAFITDEDVNARKLREILRKVKMSDNQKPSEFIMDVTSVWLMNLEIEDEDERMRDIEFVEHVIDTVPTFYKLAVVNKRRKEVKAFSCQIYRK